MAAIGNKALTHPAGTSSAGLGPSLRRPVVESPLTPKRGRCLHEERPVGKPGFSAKSKTQTMKGCIGHPSRFFRIRPGGTDIRRTHSSVTLFLLMAVTSACGGGSLSDQIETPTATQAPLPTSPVSPTSTPLPPSPTAVQPVPTPSNRIAHFRSR